MATFPGLLEFHGKINLLKAGIVAADRVNTVSPSYATETVGDPVLGCGLEGVLGARGSDYTGILNGADYGTWDPRRDPALPAVFGPGDLAGKTRCRRDLLAELGLVDDLDKPLCGFVGRLVTQKGIDLLLPVLGRLARDGFQFAILGTGEKRLEAAVAEAAAGMPERIAFSGEYNDNLAHRIYAGCDLFLMPSRFEPCGLSQMYALRYGSLPLVRRTGGLADTIVDASDKDGNGFVFEEARPEALLAAMRRAEALWAKPDDWLNLQVRGMAADFGWSESSVRYEQLYESVAESGGSDVKRSGA
jgi:starch synthase